MQCLVGIDCDWAQNTSRYHCLSIISENIKGHVRASVVIDTQNISNPFARVWKSFIHIVVDLLIEPVGQQGRDVWHDTMALLKRSLPLQVFLRSPVVDHGHILKSIVPSFRRSTRHPNQILAHTLDVSNSLCFSRILMRVVWFSGSILDKEFTVGFLESIVILLP